MLRELKQKDIDKCLELVGEGKSYDNLRTRMLAFLQAEMSHSYGYFNAEKLLGIIFFSTNAFDLTIHFLIANPTDETVIQNLVSRAKEEAKLIGAKGLYINSHNLDENILKTLEILEQYRLE